MATQSEKLLSCFTELCSSIKDINDRLDVIEGGGPLPPTQGEDLHSQSGVYQPNVAGLYDIPEVDIDEIVTGSKIQFSTTPSVDLGNDIVLGSDGKLFSQVVAGGECGFTTVNNWSELQSVVDAGEHALVCSQITAANDKTFIGTGSIKFNPLGSLDTAEFILVIDVSVINLDNHHIFFNYVINEGYPARYDNTASTIHASFGGDNERDPRWWGLVPSRTLGEADNVSATVASLNSDAIYAAAASFSINGAPGQAIKVMIPGGTTPISRPIRINDLKTILQGTSMNACKISGRSNGAFTFDTSYFIQTEDYQTEGSTPVVQIGWEILASPAVNQDNGFNTGIRDISILCPDDDKVARRISGVMWEAGLQEGTVLSYVNVENFGGYAIGGPIDQKNFHNEPYPLVGRTYLQLNTVGFDNLWIFTPSRSDAICMSVFGLNFSVDTVTVDHGRAGTGMVAPPGSSVVAAIRTGSRTCGRWSNIHIEQALADGVTGAGIYCPEVGDTADRVRFDSINYLRSTRGDGSVPPNSPARTLLLNNDRGGYSCNSISMQAGFSDRGGHACIEDLPRGKVSRGYHASLGNGTFVAQYDRQMTLSDYEVTTSDAGLLHQEEAGVDVPSLAPEASFGGTISIKCAIGNYVSLSFSQDLQGIDLRGWVSVDNTVTYRFYNDTAGTIDLATGVLKARTIPS